MTNFTISHFHGFVPMGGLSPEDPRFKNWPVVYVLNNRRSVYVGESMNVSARFAQHQKSSEKSELATAHVVVDSEFNKSAALDLESQLMALLAGDDQFEVLNRNLGIVDADYFDRDRYRKGFERIFEEFRSLGLFSRPVSEIRNSELFKLSPFKSLNPDQELTVERITLDLIENVRAGASSQSVVQGDPGTGKTVVGIYLMKLIADLGREVTVGGIDDDMLFSESNQLVEREVLKDMKIGFVVPQQALRGSIRKVFLQTVGLEKAMVLTPFQVGRSTERWDLLVVDETHRLGRRANQPSGMQNRQFAEINTRLFGSDDRTKTQLDWILEQSDHQVFLLDAAQSIKPADLHPEALSQLTRDSKAAQRFYPLRTQMRVASGNEYASFVRALLSGEKPANLEFPDYDLRLFDDIDEMAGELSRRESEVGLARMVAGFAWPWISKKPENRHLIDICIGGFSRRWNTAEVDWVNSPGAVDEVGSIHTVQGYDLNYAGVIVGKDLRFDPETGRAWFDRSNYHDKKGMEQSPSAGVEVSEEDLLRWVVNIYVVLMTRGICGTYIYVCDEPLRERMRSLLGR
jgi:DUF2075 family protein/predicted GIY-YIG superfamily endonuclease